MTARYLLDTMVVSEAFKRAPFPIVMRWLASVAPDDLVVSVVTFGEIASGVEKQRSAGSPAFAPLAKWQEAIQQEYQSRTIPITTPVALRWGILCARLKRRDTDLMIAATALEHDLTVVTRNTRHFEPTGVKLIDPYEAT